jgi:hypothetical protein
MIHLDRIEKLKYLKQHMYTSKKSLPGLARGLLCGRTDILVES